MPVLLGLVWQATEKRQAGEQDDRCQRNHIILPSLWMEIGAGLGNGGLNVLLGHDRGADALRDICSFAYDSGVKWLTVFAFSAQNWARPKSEVDGLMMLMRRFLQADAEELLKENVKLRVIGRRDRLTDDLVVLIEDVETRTKGNNGLNLTIAIDYGGQQEIVGAARCLLRKLPMALSLCRKSTMILSNHE